MTAAERSPDTAADFDSQAYVSQTAAMLGLAIPEAIYPQVVENFERVRVVAQPVLSFELPDPIEPAPTFEP